MTRFEADGRLERGDFGIDIELSLAPGRYVVRGANGSGKTSLLRLVAGLDGLSAGELTIDGVALDQPSRQLFVPAHQRDIAMAFQAPLLFDHLTAGQNVAYPIKRHHRSASPERFLDAVGATRFSGHRPSALSGGQAQRVALARALANQASTLLLDEPMSAIDQHDRDQLMGSLQDSGAKWVLWVSHDPGEPAAVDGEIVVDAQRGARLSD